MAHESLDRTIADYVNNHWDDVIADIDALVQIESVERLDEATPNAPYGPGPRAALTCALDIAKRMGFQTRDCEGRIGFADMPGTSDTQVGIIGHVDVVPAGPGWTHPPFQVTRKEGYLIGRGVADDKGPIVVALHAAKFWRDRLTLEGAAFPYTLRILFGANEETNMKDVAYYREHFDDPAFLFTPDAEFPVCYGEAGICSGTLASAPIDGGAIVRIEGGTAVNAVPGQAEAELACDAARLQPADKISVEPSGKRTLVHAQGKSAHASTPDAGESAIDLLAEHLLSADVISDDERRFLELVRVVTAHTDGSELGITASDEHFGALSCVGGTIRSDGNRIYLSIDFRYPTTITSTEIADRVQRAAERYGAAFALEHDKEPFLMDPSSAPVQALLEAYNDATGECAEPFTMKGGTYARVFTTGVSFGPEKPWEPKPSWVGSMHGPDEGIREDLLKQAFSIYVRTIAGLMETVL